MTAPLMVAGCRMPSDAGISAGDAANAQAAAIGSDALLKQMLATRQHGPMTAEAFQHHSLRLGLIKAPPKPKRVRDRSYDRAWKRKNRKHCNTYLREFRRNQTAIVQAVMARAVAITGRGRKEITGRDKHKPLIRIRWAVMLALYRNGLTQTVIAHRLHRDRTTVTHGITEAAALCETDPTFKLLCDDLTAASDRTSAERLAA